MVSGPARYGFRRVVGLPKALEGYDRDVLELDNLAGQFWLRDRPVQ